METIMTSVAVAGSSSEVTTPAACEDDARHFVVPAPLTAKASATIPTSPALPPPAPAPAPDVTLKDVKGIGIRSHEACNETESPSPRLRSSRLFKGKGKESVMVERERRKPLQLLDLPVDILKDVVKEVTHTNDLTSLARCHSALHRLTIPHIYSRFDIVWPDGNIHTEPRSGVDALTYGLATLVMAEEVFGESPEQRLGQGTRRPLHDGTCGRPTETSIRRRRGNHYAQFTRKFSLGNGPADWVQEYLITKEGGKMLGTLVALAVARMRALETFIWDMPTGILRDVWLALSSLSDREDGQPCRLEKVWVRWHDNSSPDAGNPVPPVPTVNVNAAPSATINHRYTQLGSAGGPPQIHPAVLDRVERPSFSILPALKSLSVLDIDELSYLDEMAVLIGRSLDKLRELRVGIARYALDRDWVTCWEGDNLQQIDPEFPTLGSLTIGDKRLGGVLGTLSGFVCDMRNPRIVSTQSTKRRVHSNPVIVKVEPPVEQIDRGCQTDENDGAQVDEPLDRTLGITSLKDMLPQTSPNDPPAPEWTPREETLGLDAEHDPLVAITRQTSAEPTTVPLPSSASEIQPATVPEDRFEEVSDWSETDGTCLKNVMQLDSLELERVPLSIAVMQKAFDWTRLTSLTLLHCPNHEQLWKALRRTFAPMPKSPVYPQARPSPSSTPRKGCRSSVAACDAELQYGLNLKKVHTNTVSQALISFLKETLAPNSLEVLFLQEARSYSSSVSIDGIFKGPLRRHRHSLKKLLIDSSEKGSDGLPTNSSRWRRWMLSRDILGFVCSGKMPSLRELGMAIDYRDWHFFVQNLPNIPHLRSLYIPFIADHVHGPSVDPKDLAMQIVNAVYFKPEVEVCYVGIANKCFEILEHQHGWDGRQELNIGLAATATAATDGGGDDVDEGEGAEDDEEEDADGEEVVDTESEDEDEDDMDSELDSMDGSDTARPRLREILFYDDKVAIFKARHGRL